MTTNKLLVLNLIFVDRNIPNNIMLRNIKLKICMPSLKKNIKLKKYKIYDFFPIIFFRNDTIFFLKMLLFSEIIPMYALC